MLAALPTTSDRLDQFWKAQTADKTLSQVTKFCQTKWPEKPSINSLLKPYWLVCDEISVYEQLLLRGARIIIPSCLQKEILQRLHQGHQGIVKCKLRTKYSVDGQEYLNKLTMSFSAVILANKTFQGEVNPLLLLSSHKDHGKKLVLICFTKKNTIPPCNRLFFKVC